MAHLLGGAAVALGGLGATVQGVKLLEREGVLRRPTVTMPLLVGVGSLSLALGGGLAFFRSCELRVVSSGLVSDIVSSSWKRKTMGAGRVFLRGEELAPTVRSMMGAEPLLHVAELQRSPNVLVRSTFSMLSPSDVYDALLTEVEPFAASERVAAERLTKVLSAAAEGAVLAKIRLSRDLFVFSTVSAMLMSTLLIYAFDRSAGHAEQRKRMLVEQWSRSRQNPNRGRRNEDIGKEEGDNEEP